LAGLPAAPPLWLADGAGVFVEGLVRPRIVLSRRLAEALDDRELEAVLLHELVHVRRHDGLWALAGATAVALCWMHPLVWVLRRDVAVAREFACDETVVMLQRSGRSFARGLAKAVRLASVQPAGALSIGAGDVAARLARLAAPMPAPGGAGPRWAVAIAGVLFAAVTLGANPCLK
jgi:beta-lactamase regulating signal transducer with metallopeptidase domain